MKVYLGADHRGFSLKEVVKAWLIQQGISVEDMGAAAYEKTDDYVGYAYSVAKEVSLQQSTKSLAYGIVFCGSGVGVEMVAAKVKGIRCGLGFCEAQVKSARYDDNINVLALPADFLEIVVAKKIIKVFLETAFSKEERHIRRLQKLEELDYYV